MNFQKANAILDTINRGLMCIGYVLVGALLVALIFSFVQMGSADKAAAEWYRAAQAALDAETH